MSYKDCKMYYFVDDTNQHFNSLLKIYDILVHLDIKRVTIRLKKL